MFGTVQYIQSEISFDTIRHAERFCTLTLGDSYLGLDISIDHETVCAISGLSSSCLWKACQITLPDAKNGRLIAAVPDVVRGCGYSYSGDWYIYYDQSAKVILISKSTYGTNCCDDLQYVRFLENAIAVLFREELIAIYIEDITACM